MYAKNYIPIKVTNRLALLRKRMRLTQEEMAKRSKISLRTYIYIEKGKCTPTLQTAFLIAKALGESVDKLFVLEIKKDE